MGTFGYVAALIIGLIGLQVNHVLGKDVCKRDFVTQHYCEDGYYCCHSNTRCCRLGPVLSVGAIVGIVCAVIAGISLIIVCVCISMKKKNHPGQVIHTANQPSVTVAAVSAHQYGQPVGPNQFNQYGNYGNPVGFQGQPAYPPQPQGNNQNAVYPPPPPAYAT